MLKEFREFIKRGNAIDLAVGLVIGAAFGAIVTSLVNDVVMPVVGLLLGKVDFANLFFVLKQGDPAGPYSTLALAQEAGAVTMNYGVFVSAIVSFVVVAFAVFLVVKVVNRMRKPDEEPATKDCQFCLSSIPDGATRCPACTSQLT